MERRRFLVKAGGVLVAAGATAAVDAPNVIAQPKFQWRMSATWSPAPDGLPGSGPPPGQILDAMRAGGGHKQGLPARGPRAGLRVCASCVPGHEPVRCAG